MSSPVKRAAVAEVLAPAAAERALAAGPAEPRHADARRRRAGRPLAAAEHARDDLVARDQRQRASRVDLAVADVQVGAADAARQRPRAAARRHPARARGPRPPAAGGPAASRSAARTGPSSTLGAMAARTDDIRPRRGCMLRPARRGASTSSRRARRLRVRPATRYVPEPARGAGRARHRAHGLGLVAAPALHGRRWPARACAASSPRSSRPTSTPGRSTSPAAARSCRAPTSSGEELDVARLGARRLRPRAARADRLPRGLRRAVP